VKDIMNLILNGILLTLLINAITGCSSSERFDASEYVLSEDLQSKVLVYNFYPDDINTTVQKIENNCLLYTEKFPSMKLDGKIQEPIYKYTVCTKDNKIIRDGVVVVNGSGIWNKKIATYNSIFMVYLEAVDPPYRCTISKRYKKKLLGKNRDILEVACGTASSPKISITVYASGIGFIRKTVNGISTHGLKNIRNIESILKGSKI